MHVHRRTTTTSHFSLFLSLQVYFITVCQHSSLHHHLRLLLYVLSLWYCGFNLDVMFMRRFVGEELVSGQSIVFFQSSLNDQRKTSNLTYLWLNAAEVNRCKYINLWKLSMSWLFPMSWMLLHQLVEQGLRHPSFSLSTLREEGNDSDFNPKCCNKEGVPR